MPVADPAGWSLLLPSNWHHIPLGADRHRRVAALLRSQLATLPRDAVFRWRRELEDQINALVDDAVQQGGRDLYLLIDSRYGLPLAASCLASLVNAPLPEGISGEAVANALADRDSDRPGTLLIEGRECAAIRRREPLTIEDDAAGAPASPATLMVTTLDVFAPFPGTQQTLLLSFRTPVDDLAGPMATLFEAMAQSLRWTRE